MLGAGMSAVGGWSSSLTEAGGDGNLRLTDRFLAKCHQPKEESVFPVVM